MKWAIVVFIGVALISAFYIWRLQTESGLDLALNVPDNIMSGVPFSVQVNFSNNSGSVLNNAKLTVTLPDGVVFYNTSATDKTMQTIPLGNIGQGSLIQQSVTLMMVGPAQSVQTIKAAVDYEPASLGAQFEKVATADLQVQSSGIDLMVSASSTVTSGENFETTVSYTNVSDTDFSNLQLQMSYPPTFSYVSASLPPDTGNNTWNLGALRQGSQGRIIIKGNLIGGENDSYTMGAQLFEQAVSGNNYLVSSGSATTSIAASPLAIAVHLNGQNDSFVAHTGDALNYTLSYVNGTNATVHNAVITAQLGGDMFDLSSVSAQAASQSQPGVMIWNAANTPALASLAPGSAGVVTFSVNVKKAFAVQQFSDKNYSLVVNGGIAAPAPTTDIGPLISKARMETKVAGTIGIRTKVLFRDAASGILNQGIFPPVANQTTQFTVHMLLSGAATDMSNITVQSTLGQGVKMIGTPQSNSGSLPQFDPITRQITWNVNQLQANQGVVGDPIEAVFQIEATPQESQVGTYMPLITGTTVQATDTFTGGPVTGSAPDVTTQLPDDPTVTVQGVVQPQGQQSAQVTNGTQTQ